MSHLRSRAPLARNILIALLFCEIAIISELARAADSSAAITVNVKPTLAERAVAEARRVLSNVKKTSYSHKTKIDEETGLYEIDCSGFAALILRAVSPEALAAIQKTKTKRPRAVDFYEAFAAAPTEKNASRWRRVLKLMDARPGDFVAWRKEESVKNESAGHVMIIDDVPVREANNLLRVTIIDATSKPHAKDTRKQTEDGVGRGVVWFDINEEGRPLGCRARSLRGDLIALPIAIGRLVADEE